jgi:NAD(P)H-dependent FMN reductase
MNDFRILDLAGSLRRASLHRGLIRAARELAPEGVAVEPYEKLGEIPFFNQDVEDEGDPAPVRDLKEKIREADAVIIATPEYDYAIPGVLTTALDWALRPPPPCATSRWASSGRAQAGRERRGVRWYSARSSCTPPPTSCPSPRCSYPTLARSSTWRRAT